MGDIPAICQHQEDGQPVPAAEMMARSLKTYAAAQGAVEAFALPRLTVPRRQGAVIAIEKLVTKVKAKDAKADQEKLRAQRLRKLAGC